MEEVRAMVAKFTKWSDFESAEAKKYWITGSEGGPYWDGRPKFETAFATKRPFTFQMDNHKSIGSVKFNPGVKLPRALPIVMGESFLDLKDLLRRYELLDDVSMGIPQQYNHKYALFSFPVCPWGIERNDIDFDVLHNQVRGGHIQTVAMGYRYFRGGLRYKFVFPSLPNVSVWIQHRPDDMRITPFKVYTKPTGVNTLLQQSYGYYLQDLSVNTIIEIEIPFYNANNYIFANPSDMNLKTNASAFSLGTIYGGLMFNTKIVTTDHLNMSVYYALADDAEFSCYIGYPFSLFLNQVDFKIKEGLRKQYLEDVEKVEEQLRIMENIIDETDKLLKEVSISDSDDELLVIDKEEVDESLLAQFEMMTIKNYFKRKTDEVVDEVIADKTEEMTQKINQITTDLTASLSEITPELNRVKNEVLITLISEMAHCMVSNRWETYCISFCTFFVRMGIVSASALTSLIKCVSDIMKSFYEPKVDDEIQLAPLPSTSKGYCTFEMSPIVDNLDFLLSTLWCGICSLFDNKSSMNSKYVQSFRAQSGSFARDANFMTFFFKNVIKVVKQMYDEIMCKSIPEATFLNLLARDSELVVHWVTEVMYLTDPVNRNRIYGSPDMHDRVYMCATYGVRILAFFEEGEQTKNYTHLFTYLSKINAVKSELLAMGKYPYVRREPFVVYMCGETGIGKSSMSEAVTTELLRSQNIKTYGEKTLTLNPTSDFWNGCNHQPVLYIDDFMSVVTPGALDNQLHVLYTVKSSAILNPNMADLSEKKKRYAPEIMYICSNFPYVNNVQGLMDLNAINRRRDVLVEAVLKEQYKGVKLNTLPREVLDNFGHLQFRLASNVIDVRKNQWSQLYSYDEFIVILKKKYSVFYDNEMLNFQRRMESVYAVSCIEDDGLLHLSDPGELHSYISDKIEKENAILLRREIDVLENNKYFKVPEFLNVKNIIGKYMRKQKIEFEQDSLDVWERIKEFFLVNGIDISAIYLDLRLEPCSHLLKYLNDTNDRFKEYAKKNFTTFETMKEFYEWLGDYLVYVERKSICNRNVLCSHLLLNERFTFSTISGDFKLHSRIIKSMACEDFCVLKSCKIFWFALLSNYVKKNLDMKLHLFRKQYKFLPGAYVTNVLQGQMVNVEMNVFKKLVAEMKVAGEKLYSLLSSGCRLIWDFLRKYWPVIGATFLVMLPAVVITKAEQDLKYYNMSIQSGTYDNRILYKKNKLNVSEKKKFVVPESGTQEINQLITKIENNTVFLNAHIGSDIIKVRCLMLGNRKMLVLKHYIETFENLQYDHLSIKINNIKYNEKLCDIVNVELDFSSVIYLENSNFGIIDVPPIIPMFKNMSNCFATRVMHEVSSRQPGRG